MNTFLKKHIEYFLSIIIERTHTVAGGDISKAYLLETDSERFFCKVNFDKSAHKMCLAEKKGLQAISKTNTIAIPNVLLCGQWETGAFLLMEYVPLKRPSKKDMALFGLQLAALHELSESNTFE